MSYSYDFIEHTADIAVELKADSLNEIFTAAALAWKEAVTDSPADSENEIKFMLSESSIENLLVQFLNELNFQLNVKKWILSSVKEMDIINNENLFYLKTVLSGESFNEKKHELKEEIKAVTYHQMEIKKENGTYFTRIVFDI